MLKRIWNKIKAWVVAVLLALGLIAAPVLAGTKDFSYTAASLYEDGTPLPLTEIAETRLYCDNDPIPKASELGADGNFSGVVFAPGSHSCHATHVAVNGLESGPSNTVTFVVMSDAPPNPPQGLSVN